MKNKASVQLLIVRVQLLSPHTSPPVFEWSMEGRSQWEGVGFYFFGCLGLICVCVRVYVDF